MKLAKLYRGAVAVCMGTERAISLSFFESTTILMEACGMEAAARVAFEARIRQLQRLSLPAKERGAKAEGRVGWGIPELAGLATAIRLMAAFMMPTLAARYAAEREVDLAPFWLAGTAAVLPSDYVARRTIALTSIAIFKGVALEGMGQKGRHDERYDGALGDITLCAEVDTIDLASAAGGAGIFLDSSTFMPIIVTRAAEISMATEDELAFELDRMRFV